MYTPATTPRQPSLLATQLQGQIDTNQQAIEAARETISALEQKVAHLEQFERAVLPALEQLLRQGLDPDKRQELLNALNLA